MDLRSCVRKGRGDARTQSPFASADHRFDPGFRVWDVSLAFSASTVAKARSWEEEEGGRKCALPHFFNLSISMYSVQAAKSQDRQSPSPIHFLLRFPLSFCLSLFSLPLFLLCRAQFRVHEHGTQFPLVGCNAKESSMAASTIFLNSGQLVAINGCPP